MPDSLNANLGNLQFATGQLSDFGIDYEPIHYHNGTLFPLVGLLEIGA